jgi:anti-sigma-K factor RskA
MGSLADPHTVRGKTQLFRRFALSYSVEYARDIVRERHGHRLARRRLDETDLGWRVFVEYAIIAIVAMGCGLSTVQRTRSEVRVARVRERLKRRGARTRLYGR